MERALGDTFIINVSNMSLLASIPLLVTFEQIQECEFKKV